ncbi:MAG: hypothetical protein IT377_09135 [Polyangiaceae bacterium]|nr:hypothetical protein [Polyangiaceae bacterium]
MTLRPITAASILLPLVTAACSSTSSQVLPPRPSIDVVRYYPPQRSVYIRAGFDSDPSRLLGNFLRADLAPDEIDENRAARTTCSKFIKSTVIPAGGTYSHTLNASRDVRANLAVKPFFEGGGGTSDEAGIQVTYTLQKKMVHEITDPDGLAACCENTPDQCARIIIGEFWYGSGSVMEFAGAEKDAKAQAAYKIASGDFSFKDGWAWKKANEWQDQYFAFRTQEATLGGSGLCGRDYVNQLPQAPDGKFFVGVSPPSATESKARELALRDAQTQVIRYLGTAIGETYAATSTALDGILEDETLVAAGAKGIAAKVKDRCWRPIEEIPGPDRLKTIKVLAFYPEAELKADQQAAIAAMQAEAERTGKKSAAGSLKGIANTISTQ